MMFETATVLRLAPGLISCVFLWTITSALFGDVHLPTLHRSAQPVSLQAQDSVYQGLWEQQNKASDPTSTSADQLHEGRLLQIAPNSTDTVLNPSAHNISTTLFVDRNNASSTSQDSSSLNLETDRSAINQQHTDTAGFVHKGNSSSSSSSRNHLFASSVQDTQLPHGDNSTASLSSLSRHATSDAMQTAVEASDIQQAGNQSSRTISNASGGSDALTTSAHSSVPAEEIGACPPHLDLPMPGLDIAPADDSKCYTHPAEYVNKNFLNDSYYMVYHHDLMPSTEPHPAFTWGDISRFSHAMRKMKRGDPVKAVFVGGSVSSSYCRNPSVTCWVKPVSDWLQQQNPNVKIINNAVGGTTSRTTAECFDAMVSTDADLVFLEYSYNDRFGIDPHQQQQGYEMLVRKLLKLPHKPAIVIVHWWGPRHDCIYLLSEAEAIARSQRHADHRCAMTLWNTTEDRIQTIVQHYGVQSISFRNAFWAEIDAEVDGYRPDQTLMPDSIHPNQRGVELLGNLVIKFVTDAQERMSRWGQSSHSSSSQLPEPLYVDAAVDDQSNTCTRGDALQDMLVHLEKWYWVDGKKPGFQTETPTASLVLMVTLPDTAVSKLSLGYLASYEGMGWAQVECLGACSCHRMKIDANSTARASQEHFATIDVERQNDGSGCLLKVSNLDQSSSVGNGHKFKVSSVAWSGENQSAGDKLQSNQQDVATPLRDGGSLTTGSTAETADHSVMIGSI